MASRDLRGAIDVVPCELFHLAVQLISEVIRQAEVLLAIDVIWIVCAITHPLMYSIPHAWLESAHAAPNPIPAIVVIVPSIQA